MLVYCSVCVCNLFIRSRDHWPASVKLVTLRYVLCCAEFRIGRATILVATDVAARGLGE